jgi:hypothetical protein
MKLSENTMNILKNFSTINSGMVLQPGTYQRTIDAINKSILAEATLEDSFPQEFGIYDLNRFLGTLSMLKDPEITFEDRSVIINDGEITLTYFPCSPNLIVTPPDKVLSLTNVNAKFSLSASSMQKLLKLAAMNNLPNLSILGKNGDLGWKIHEATNDTSNHGFMNIGAYGGPDFVATFNKDNLKLLPLDYEVEVQSGAFAKFTSVDGKIRYFVALESN